MNTLATILQTDYLRQQLSVKTAGQMSASTRIPTFSEMTVGDVNPLLATNMRGTFLPTRTNGLGIARLGFSDVPVADEGPITLELYKCLYALSVERKWPNRFATPLEGIQYLKDPKYIVLPKTTFSGEDETKWELDKLTLIKDYADKGVEILVAEIPEGTAIVTAEPKHVGFYMRIGDYLGLLFTNIDRSIALIASQ